MAMIFPSANPSLVDPGGAGRGMAPTGPPSPDLAAMPFREQAELWRNNAGAWAATGHIAASVTDVVARVEDDYNQVRVDDALNRARREALRLQYDPQEGYLARQGDSVFTGGDGTLGSGPGGNDPRPTLTTEYNEKFQSTLSDLSAQLGNDRQRQVFAMRSNDLATVFSAGVQSHEMQQFKSYYLSTYDGQIKLGLENAERNWNNPASVDDAINSAASGLVRASKFTGWSPNEITSRLLTLKSAANTKVIEAALSQGDYAYAIDWFNDPKRRATMTANDILTVQGKITHVVEGAVAQQNANATAQDFAPRFQPSEQNRMKDAMGFAGVLTSGVESRGQDYDAKGNPLKGPGWKYDAQGNAVQEDGMYRMQVTPKTAADPGFGITPARDQSPSEYNRVGLQLLDVYIRKYGTPELVFAAYNAGSDAVDNAVRKAQAAGPSANWQDYLSEGTRGYIKNAMGKYGSAQSIATMPTEDEFVGYGMAKLGTNITPTQEAAARQQLIQRFGMLTKSRQETADTAVANAQREIYDAGGDLSKLSANTAAAVRLYAPGKYAELANFAKTLQKGEQVSNPELYLNLVTHPETMRDMTDNQFLQLRMQLSPRDFDMFAKSRANLIAGVDDEKASQRKVANDEISNQLKIMGIEAHPTIPKDGVTKVKAIADLNDYVHDDLQRQQQLVGHKLNGLEIENRVKTLFATNTEVRSGFLQNFFGKAPSEAPLVTATVDQIPTAKLAQIRDSLTARGIRNPTDNQILRAFRMLEQAGGGYRRPTAGAPVSSLVGTANTDANAGPGFDW